MSDDKNYKKPHLLYLLFLTLTPKLSIATEPDDTVILDDLVVTSEKREEKLHDVPVSIGLVESYKLQETNIDKIEELQDYIPNLTITETGIGNFISIRGISTAVNPGFEQSVGTYVDGIYHGRSQQVRMPFLDLERVEVLRGSRIILFGQNSVAGALSLITARPTDYFEAEISSLYEPEFNERQITAIVSGPLSEDLRGRLAVRSLDMDGYIENLTLNRDDPERTDRTIRGTLDWEVTNSLDLSLKVEFSRFDVTGRQVEVIDEQPALFGPFTGFTYGQILTQFGQHPSVLNNTQDFKRSANGDTSDNDSQEFVLTANYALGDHTLTSITGYSGYKFFEFCDCDVTGGNVIEGEFDEDFDQFSQEIRLASSRDRKFDYLLGLFFQYQNVDYADSFIIPEQSIIEPVVNNLTRSTAGSLLTNTRAPRKFDQKTQTWAAFAQGGWNVSDHIRLTAALRVTHEKKKASKSIKITDNNGNPLPASTAPIVEGLYSSLFNFSSFNLHGDRTDTRLYPSLGLQYKFNNNILSYATWTRGSKSGGFDARSNNAPAMGGTFAFENEKADNYELGTKLLFGHTAELNIGLYRIEFEDLQVIAFDGIAGFNTSNAASAVSQGIEIDGRWKPVNGLTLSASLGTIDFEFKEYFGQCFFGQIPDAPDGINCSYAGKSNQFTPDWSGIISADYFYPISDSLDLHTTLDVIHVDEFQRSETPDPNQIQNAYTKINARIAIGSKNGDWELALIGRNLTDEVIIPYSSPAPLAGAVFGAPSIPGFIEPPRTVALQAIFRF